MSYLCVDGGQTKTAVFVLDEGGAPIHAWRAAPLTTPHKPGAADALRLTVRGIAYELRRRLGGSGHALPEAACFSLTGYLDGDGLVPPLVREEMGSVVPEVQEVHVIPDYVGNWAAATRGEPGIVVISGGGAVAYGRAASGRSLRVGGLGHLLGDEGSGFWIGLEATKAALGSWSGLSPKTALEERLMRFFGASSDAQVVRKVYSGAVSEAQIAGLVPLVVELADKGDAVAEGILDRAALHLAGFAGAVRERLGALPVYPSGGVFEAPTMRERFDGVLARTGRAAEAVVGTDPVQGALLVAKGEILR